MSDRQHLELRWSADQRTMYADLRAPSREASNKCVEDLVTYLGQTLDNGNTFTLRINTVESAACGSQGIKTIVAFMRKYRPKCARQMRGSALVIQRKLVRWVINTLFYIQAPASPVTVVSTLEGADAYIARALAGAVADDEQVRVDSGMIKQLACDAQDKAEFQKMLAT